MELPQQQAGFTPTIKCSTCDNEVPMHLLAEHVCDKVSALPAVQEPDQTQVPSIESMPIQTRSRKPSRPFVPRIDPFAPSRMIAQGQLTPASSRPGSAASSISPVSGRRAHNVHPLRKVPTTAVRRPPSPELLSQDCAFPPFPSSKTKKKESSKNTAESRVSEVYSLRSFGHERKRSASVGASRTRMRPGMEDSSRPSTASSSRQPSLSSRAGSRQGSLSVVPPLPALQSTVSMPLSDPGVSSGASEQDSMWPLPLVEVQSRDGASEKTPSLLEVTNVSSSEREAPSPITSPQTTSTEDTPTSSTPTADSQSREPSYKSKRPPPIANMPPNGLEQPSLANAQPSPSLQTPPTPSSTIARTLTSFFSKKRGQSTSSKKSGSKVPAADGPRFIALSPDPDPQDVPRALHSSHSSINMEMASSPPVHGVQEVSQAPTGTTKAEQILPESLQAQVVQQEDDHEDVHVETHGSQRDTVQLEEDFEKRLAVMTGTPQLSVIEEKTEDLKRASIDSASSYGSIGFSHSTTSSRSFHGFEGHSIGSSISTARTMSSNEDLLMPPSMKFTHLDNVPDSPTDPCLQHGRLAPVHEAETLLDSSEDDEPLDSYFQAGRLTPVAEVLSSPELEKKELTHPMVLPISPPAEPEMDGFEVAMSLRDRRPSTPGGVKGICRGCSKPITSGQKSVSSKDGRLTGKYHKECFVCMTCKEPFATADFYVHEDHPYCAHHYHVLNETLCDSCGKGIEGHYLETSNVSGSGAKKFHPDCLTCATCKIQLSDDYFELGDRVYCEKDAFRVASGSRSPYDTAPSRPSPLNREYVASGVAGQALTAGRFPERRLTKLMNTF